MGNRAQRRNASRVMKNPEMKRYADKFAKEMSDLLMEQFEKAKEHAETNGGDFKLNFENGAHELLERKGIELGQQVNNMIKSSRPAKEVKELQRKQGVMMKVNIR